MTFSDASWAPRSRLLRSLRWHLIALAAVLGCISADVPGSPITVKDSAGVTLTTVTAAPDSVPVWTLEQEPLRVLTGDGSGDSTAFDLIGSAKWLSTGGLAITDGASNRILIFDATGHFVRSLGRSGDGPGESRRLGALTVGANDTMSTFDPRLRRLSVWHPAAGFIRSVNLADGGSLDAWPAQAWRWRDGSIVVFQLATTPLEAVPPGAGIRRWPTKAHITMRDSSGGVRYRSPTFPGMYSGLLENGDIRAPFSNQPFVTPASDGVYFGSGADFELWYADETLSPVRVIRWPSHTELLVPGEVEQLRLEFESSYRGPAMPERVRMAFQQAYSPELLPERRPAIGRVFVDAEDRVWIERFEPIRMGTAPQKPGDQWSILRDDGTPVAILKLPPHTRLEDVRGNDVVVVRRDSLDVLTVAVHRLRR